MKEYEGTYNEYRDEPRRDDAGVKPNGQANPGPGPSPRLQLLDVAAWDEIPVPPRQWWDTNRVPSKSVTLISGDGGTGKTTLMMQGMCAGVLGRQWIDSTPEKGPTLGVFCEDDEEELHRRFATIAAFYGVSMKRLADGGLNPVSLVGKETLLAIPDRNGVMTPTTLFAGLWGTALDIRPGLIVIDNLADVFGGNENDRAQVRQFIGLLRGMALDVRAAVALTGHPSLQGMSSGSGSSGSTGWNASVRSRLYLRKPTKTEKDGDQGETETDERVLEVMKANYGPTGETIRLKWENGLFLPVGGTGTRWLDKRAAADVADELFLELLKELEGQGRKASHQPTSHNYAPKLMAEMPQAKAKRFAKQALQKAMERLFADKKIKAEDCGIPSRPSSKLVIAT